MTQLQTDFDAHADSLWEQLAPLIQPDSVEDRDWIVAIEVHGHEKDAARLERLYRILAEIMMGICATRGETT